MDVFELDVVEISQNERYVPTRGWSSRNLFASDPRHYASACCGGDGPDAAAPLGRGESWTDASWRVRIDERTDPHGWVYARTFGSEQPKPKASLTAVARWRTWARGASDCGASA